MINPRGSTEITTMFSVRINVRPTHFIGGLFGVQICSSDATDSDPDDYECFDLTVSDARALAVALYRATTAAEEEMG